MALSSDETIKREIIDEVGASPFGFEARVFLEGSNDDQKLFKDGGLTFQYKGQTYGSCDLVYVQDQGSRDEKAVLAIEGTDCLNRGSSGNAQYQRIHHVLGALHNDIIGIYYLKKGKHKIQEDLYGMTYQMSKLIGTPYLVTSDLGVIKDILRLKREDNNKNLEKYIDDYLEITNSKWIKKFNEKYKSSWKIFGQKRSTVIFDKYVIKYSARKYRDFTDSSQRGGHVALGELNLTKHFFFNKKVIYLWPRINRNELKKLIKKKVNDKEWSLIINDKNTIIANLTRLSRPIFL